MLLTASIASLLAWSSVATSAQLQQHKRAPKTEVDLYVYGVGAGLPIIYADGLAYFGASGPSDATVKSLVTFTLDDANTSVPWTIAANSTTVSFNETMSMYIIPTAGSFSQVGFSTADALPEGAVNTGFGFYGSNVAYAAQTSNYELRFWANATSTLGVYALYWDAGSNSKPRTAFAVSVKNTAPVFPENNDPSDL